MLTSGRNRDFSRRLGAGLHYKPENNLPCWVAHDDEYTAYAGIKDRGGVIDEQGLA